jgi:hypothetical protein
MSTTGYRRTTENNNQRTKKRSLCGVVLGASLCSHGELKSFFGCSRWCVLWLCYGGGFVYLLWRLPD